MITLLLFLLSTFVLSAMADSYDCSSVKCADYENSLGVSQHHEGKLHQECRFKIVNNQLKIHGYKNLGNDKVDVTPVCQNGDQTDTVLLTATPTIADFKKSDAYDEVYTNCCAKKVVERCSSSVKAVISCSEQGNSVEKVIATYGYLDDDHNKTVTVIFTPSEGKAECYNDFNDKGLSYEITRDGNYPDAETIVKCGSEFDEEKLDVHLKRVQRETGEIELKAFRYNCNSQYVGMEKDKKLVGVDKFTLRTVVEETENDSSIDGVTVAHVMAMIQSGHCQNIANILP